MAYAVGARQNPVSFFLGTTAQLNVPRSSAEQMPRIRSGQGAQKLVCASEGKPSKLSFPVRQLNGEAPKGNRTTRWKDPWSQRHHAEGRPHTPAPNTNKSQTGLCSSPAHQALPVFPCLVSSAGIRALPELPCLRSCTPARTGLPTMCLFVDSAKTM